MYLSKIHLNLRCREVRRDLSDPYQLHATLCRAFCPQDHKCAPGEVLWRLEPEREAGTSPRILVQSRSIPDWKGIGIQGWLEHAYPPVDLNKRLQLDTLAVNARFRFRLRANPCVTRNGKRLGLLKQEEQEEWLTRKAELHGFALPRATTFDLSEPHPARIDVRLSQEHMIRGRQHSGNSIRIFSVLYDGILSVRDPERFKGALQNGIGHGKVMGLGLLSVAPMAKGA